MVAPLSSRAPLTNITTALMWAPMRWKSVVVAQYRPSPAAPPCSV